jgi:hypothetical protein
LLLGPSCFLCAPALFCLRGFAPRSFLRLGPSGFLCLPAFFRFRGFAQSLFFRLGFCAFLGQLLFQATRFLFFAQPRLLALFFFLLAATCVGPSGFLCAPALFCLRGLAVSPLFRLGLCAFLLLLLAAAFLCAGSFFNAPALFRLGGLATGPLFRFGLLALLGQPLLLASLLVLGAFRLFAFPFFSAFGALAAPLLFAPAAILGLPLLLGLALLPAPRLLRFALAQSGREREVVRAMLEGRFVDELGRRHLDIGFNEL